LLIEVKRGEELFFKFRMPDAFKAPGILLKIVIKIRTAN
jgi:hypothetical protein